MRNAIDNLMNTELVRARRTGYTTNLVNLVKHMNGTLLCHTTKEANRIQREYGIKAKSVQSNLRGTEGPYFWDSPALMVAHYEVTCLLQEKDNQIKALKDQITQLNDQLEKIYKKTEELADLTGVLREYY